MPGKEKVAMRKGNPTKKTERDQDTLDQESFEAIKNGDIETLKQLMGYGYQCEEYHCSLAASHKQLKILTFLRIDNKIPWDDRTFTEAVQSNYQEIIDFCFENKCPFETDTCTESIVQGNYQLTEALLKAGCPCDEGTFAATAIHGNENVVDLLLKYKCPYDTDVCTTAAGNGLLLFLKILRWRGFPWNEKTPERAASRGYLECLKFAHKDGCVVGNHALWMAAQNGHADCFEYLLDYGPRFSKTLEYCLAAIESGYLNILKIAIEHGFPLTQGLYNLAVYKKNEEIIAYLKSVKCPGSSD